MNKKGLSPVIGTMLLIVLAVVIIGYLFFWIKGFVVDLAPKGLQCDEVKFDAGIIYDASSERYVLDIVNVGNIPLQGFMVKRTTQGFVKVEEEISGRVEPGNSQSFVLANVNQPGTFLIVPMLLETRLDDVEIVHLCDDEFGKEVEV